MSNLKDLREKRGRLVKEAREFLEIRKKGGENLSEEDEARWSKYMDDIDTLGSDIEKEERMQELERESAATFADAERNKPQSKEEAVKDPSQAQMRAFGKALTHGYQSLTQDEQRALSFDNDAQGGYLAAPQAFINQLIKFVDDEVFMRTLSNVLPPLVGAHSAGAPSLENDPADAAWTSEIGSVSEDSTMSFGNRELMPHLLTKLVKVSMKLLTHSALPAENIVRDRLGYKFGISLEKGYLTGSGASQPLGVFTASANGISTSRDVSTGNTTTSIGADGLMEAMYNVKSQYQQRGSWIFHRDGVKQIRKLKDGNGQYLWQPGLQGGEPDRLLMRPLFMSEYAPNTFTTGLYVGIFGDFQTGYWIIDSMALEVQRLNELYAATSQVGFIGRMYSDGMPVLEEAFSRVKLA